MKIRAEARPVAWREASEERRVGGERVRGQQDEAS